jgi:hypothetical protein
MPKYSFLFVSRLFLLKNIFIEPTPTPPCPLMTDYLVSRLSFFVRCLSSVARLLSSAFCHPSSVAQAFVPLRFAIFFTQKYLSLIPLMEHNYNPPLTDEQWAKLEPIIPPPEYSASMPPCLQFFKHPF